MQGSLKLGHSREPAWVCLFGISQPAQTASSAPDQIGDQGSPAGSGLIPAARILEPDECARKSFRGCTTKFTGWAGWSRGVSNLTRSIQEAPLPCVLSPMASTNGGDRCTRQAALWCSRWEITPICTCEAPGWELRVNVAIFSMVKTATETPPPFSR